jgi:cytochrome c
VNDRRSLVPKAAIILAWAVAASSVAVSAHAQDVEAGKKAFAQCAACHTIDGKAGLGPSLKGVVGRTAGTLPGFHYSRGMSSAGVQWTATSLAAFLADPQKTVPGNVMPFSGIPDVKQRGDLVAYLQTLQ